MLATVFLLVTSLAGFAVATRALPTAPLIVRAPAGFLGALIVTSWTTYLVADRLAGHSVDSLRIGLLVSTALGLAVLGIWGRSLHRSDFRLPLLDGVVAVFAFAIAGWLMNARLKEQAGQLVVTSNTWGDAGLHIALSRSFAVGGNYPTEYPFFSGEPIRYHFGFDFFAGMLQKGGLSVLGAFNLPGILGLATMILVTFATARMLFSPAPPEPAAAAGTAGDGAAASDAAAAVPRVRWWRDQGVWIGFVGIALLLTNQSQSWRRYLAKDGHGNLLTALDPSVWWKHQGYLATGPYTNDRITLYNTLNPYLGQTHLIIGVAIVLLFSYVLIAELRTDAPRKRVVLGVGAVFGAAFWLNGVVWLGGAVYFSLLLALWGAGAIRRAAREAQAGARWAAARAAARPWLVLGICFLIPALLLGVPQAKALSGGSGTSLNVHLGWLVCASDKVPCHAYDQMHLLSPRDWWSFIEFWWLNQGLAIPLMLLAFVLGTGRDRKILAAVTGIFIWGSIFSVGTDIGGFNHKTFNLWEALADLYVAFAIVQLWLIAGRLLRGAGFARRALGWFGRLATVFALFFLLVSGLIDVMTVKNDFTVGVFGDESQVETTDWIVRQTPPRANFLTDYDQLYNAPLMAGRRVVLGYSPWAASSGYDVDPRKALIKSIYEAPDKASACTLLTQNGVDDVLIGPQERTSERFKVNDTTWSQFTVATTIGDGDQQYKIYRVVDNC